MFVQHFENKTERTKCYFMPLLFDYSRTEIEKDEIKSDFQDNSDVLYLCACCPKNHERGEGYAYNHYMVFCI